MKLSRRDCETVLGAIYAAEISEHEFIRCNVILYSDPVRYCDALAVKNSRSLLRRMGQMRKRLLKELRKEREQHKPATKETQT